MGTSNQNAVDMAKARKETNFNVPSLTHFLHRVCPLYRGLDLAQLLVQMDLRSGENDNR